MQIVIDIPEGLKHDFENEQWTALSCMEMKDAIVNGTVLPKGHERVINADALARRIAGHSDYHGDDILCAIYCMAEGNYSDKPIKPLESEVQDADIN